jgi:hypothetical protein
MLTALLKSRKSRFSGTEQMFQMLFSVLPFFFAVQPALIRKPKALEQNMYATALVPNIASRAAE